MTFMECEYCSSRIEVCSDDIKNLGSLDSEQLKILWDIVTFARDVQSMVSDKDFEKIETLLGVR